MNSELRKILAECIADMDRGAAVEDCLKRNPSMAATLRPHLDTWVTLGSASLVQPPMGAFNRGRREMLSALRGTPAGFRPLAAARLAPTWATVAAAVVGLVVLLGGAAGTSAALGGPDVAGDAVGGVVGVFNDRDDGDVDDVDDGEVTNQDYGCLVGASPTPEAVPAASPEVDAGVDDGDVNDLDDVDSENVDEGDSGDAGADCPDTDENGVAIGGADGNVDEGEDANGDENNGHGNEADHDDEGNPGQGQGNHGANAGGQANGNGNANANGNANGGNGLTGPGGDKKKD